MHTHDEESHGPYSIDGRGGLEMEKGMHSYDDEDSSVDEVAADTEPGRGIPLSAICHEAGVLAIVSLLSLIQGAILLPFLLLYAILVTLVVTLLQCIRFHDRAFLHIFYSKRIGTNVRVLMALAVPIVYLIGSALLLVVVTLLTIVFSFAEPFFLNSLNLRQQVLTECEHVVAFLLSGVLDSVHVANKYLDAFVVEFFSHSMYSHMRRFSDQFYDDEPVEIRPGYFLLMILSGVILGALQAVNFFLIAALGAIPSIVAGYTAVVANPEQFGLGRKQIRHKVCKFFGRMLALILWPVGVVLCVALAPLVGFGLGCKSGWIVYFTTGPRWKGGGLFLNNYPHDVYKLPSEMKELEAEAEEEAAAVKELSDAEAGPGENGASATTGATVAPKEPSQPKYKPLPRGLSAGVLDWWADVGFALDTSIRTILNQPPGRPLQFPLLTVCRCDEATRDPHACRGILAALALGLVGSIAMPVFVTFVSAILGLPIVARSFAKAWEYFRPNCTPGMLRRPGQLARVIVLQTPGFFILLVLVIPAHVVFFAVFIAVSVIVGLQSGFRAMEETEAAWTRGMLSIGQTMRNIDHELIMYVYDTEDRDVVPCTLIPEALLLRCEEDVELDDEFDRQIHAAAALEVGPRYIGAMWTPEGLRRTDTHGNLAEAVSQAGGAPWHGATAVSASHALPPHRRDKDPPTVPTDATDDNVHSHTSDKEGDEEMGDEEESGGSAKGRDDAWIAREEHGATSPVEDSRSASVDGLYRVSTGDGAPTEEPCCLCCVCFAPAGALRDEIPGLRETQEAGSQSRSRSRSPAPSPAPSRTGSVDELGAVDDTDSVAEADEGEVATDKEGKEDGEEEEGSNGDFHASSAPRAPEASAAGAEGTRVALERESSAAESAPKSVLPVLDVSPRRRQSPRAPGVDASDTRTTSQTRTQTVHEWPSDSRGPLDEPSSDDGDDSDDESGQDDDDAEQTGRSRSRMHEQKEGEERTDTSQDKEPENDDVIEVVVSDDEEEVEEQEQEEGNGQEGGASTQDTSGAAGTGSREGAPAAGSRERAPAAGSPAGARSQRAAEALARAQRLLEQSRHHR